MNDIRSIEQLFNEVDDKKLVDDFFKAQNEVLNEINAE